MTPEVVEFWQGASDPTTSAGVMHAQPMRANGALRGCGRKAARPTGCCQQLAGGCATASRQAVLATD